MSLFFVTYNQGRTDNVKLEASSITNILEFFNKISTASVTIIKKVVFSRDDNISYIVQHEKSMPFYREVRVYAGSKNYSKIITFRFVDVSVTDKAIITSVKRYCLIENEKITTIYNIIRFK